MNQPQVLHIEQDIVLRLAQDHELIDIARLQKQQFDYESKLGRVLHDSYFCIELDKTIVLIKNEKVIGCCGYLLLDDLNYPYIFLFVVDEKYRGRFYLQKMLYHICRFFLKEYGKFWFCCLRNNYQLLTPFYRMIYKIGLDDCLVEEQEDPYLKIGVISESYRERRS